MYEKIEKEKKIEEFVNSKIGPTGEFPEGRISKDDNGELAVGFTVSDGNVIMKFGKPVEWIGFPPDNARQFAVQLLELAGQIDGTITEVIFKH